MQTIYALSLYKNKLSIKKIVNLPEADQKSLDKHTKAHYHIRNQSVSSIMLSMNFISPHLRAYDYDLHEDRYVISLVYTANERLYCYCVFQQDERRVQPQQLSHAPMGAARNLSRGANQIVCHKPSVNCKIFEGKEKMRTNCQQKLSKRAKNHTPEFAYCSRFSVYIANSRRRREILEKWCL